MKESSGVLNLHALFGITSKREMPDALVIFQPLSYLRSRGFQTIPSPFLADSAALQGECWGQTVFPSENEGREKIPARKGRTINCRTCSAETFCPGQQFDPHCPRDNVSRNNKIAEREILWSCHRHAIVFYSMHGTMGTMLGAILMD